MSDLAQWVRDNVQRPLSLAVGALLFAQFGYLGFLASERYHEQIHLIDRLVETASLGVQQGNRSLVESTLITGLRSSAAMKVASCRYGKAELYYPLGGEDPCGRTSTPLRWVVRRNAVGVESHEFIFIIDGARVLSPLAMLLAITATLSMALLGIFSRARRLFSADVLEPLREGLNSDRSLAIQELDELRQRNKAHNELSRKQAVSDAIYAQSTQVAHDIRSPLAALEVAAEELSEVAEDRRAIILASVSRISDIANNLLDRRRAVSVAPAAVSIQKIFELVEPVVAEKRLQFRAKPAIVIDLKTDEAVRGCLVSVNPGEFQRLFSNLVNNAVEAIETATGTVMIQLDARGSDASLCIRDNGKGIPPDVLVKIGQRGETYGKSGGSGLGLYHARSCVESWGGRLEIESPAAGGAIVTVLLPLVSGASSSECDAVLIDDDKLVRANWRMSASKAGKRIRLFGSVSEFFAEAATIGRETVVYIDSDLGEGIKGEVEARRIHAMGFKRIYLATGYDAEKFAGSDHLTGVVGKKAPWSAA